MAKKKKTAVPAMPEKKIKVLAYCDSPTCATGFGTVSRNILAGLYSTGRFDIDILGINYWGDPHNFPFRIWPTGVNGERDLILHRLGSHNPNGSDCAQGTISATQAMDW